MELLPESELERLQFEESHQPPPPIPTQDASPAFPVLHARASPSTPLCPSVPSAFLCLSLPLSSPLCPMPPLPLSAPSARLCSPLPPSALSLHLTPYAPLSTPLPGPPPTLTRGNLPGCQRTMKSDDPGRKKNSRALPLQKRARSKQAGLFAYTIAL